jgi:hypothetical protein
MTPHPHPLAATAVDTAVDVAAALPTAVPAAVSGVVEALPAVLLLLVLLPGAVYALACWVRPVAPCRACDGNGRLRTPSGRAWLRCPACQGVGARIRAGRRAFNTSRRIGRDAAHLSHHDTGQRLAHVPTTPDQQPTAHRPPHRPARRR